jgi:tetratricopeptide (TPR) repeat protein
LSKDVIVGKELDQNSADPMQSFTFYQQSMLNKSIGTGDQEIPRQISSSFLDKMQRGMFDQKNDLRIQAYNVVRPPLEAAWHSYPYDLQTPIALAKVVAVNAEAAGDKKGILEAVGIIKEARKLSPERVELISDESLYELAAGDVTSSVAGYEEMVRLTPNVPYSHWSLGYAYLEAGRIADAQREMETALKDPDLHAMVYSQGNLLRRLINLYVDEQRWPDLADAYRSLLSLEPTNASAWGALALTYQKLGDYSNAISAAQEASKADPQFTGAANQLIKELQTQQRQGQR